MSNVPISVLIVDDHLIVRKGMRAFLNEIDGIEVVGDAANGQEAVDFVKSLAPDVVLMDLMMPEMDGVDAIKQIHLQNQDIRVLVMTSFIVEERLFAALMAGAHNYLLKHSTPDELAEKIQQTYQSRSDLHSKIARKVFDAFTDAPPDRSLTACQTQILELLNTGMTTEEAAEQMGIQPNELRQQIFHILQKLHDLSTK